MEEEKESRIRRKDTMKEERKEMSENPDTKRTKKKTERDRKRNLETQITGRKTKSRKTREETGEHVTPPQKRQRREQTSGKTHADVPESSQIR